MDSKTRKNKIDKKLDHMAALLQMIEDLTHSGDWVVNEISSATTLLKGLRSEVAELIDDMT